MGASMRVPLLPRGHPGETVGVMFCNKRMWQKASALVKTQICDRNTVTDLGFDQSTCLLLIWSPYNVKGS